MDNSPQKFDILSVLTDSVKPTDFVVIPTNAQAIYTYNVLETQINRITDAESTALSALIKEQEKVAQEIEDSNIEVHIIALSDEVRRAAHEKVRKAYDVLERDPDELPELSHEQYAADLDAEILSRAITKVVRVSDREEDTDITPAKVAALRGLPSKYYNAIVVRFRELSLEQVLYTAQADDPNFS